MWITEMPLSICAHTTAYICIYSIYNIYIYIFTISSISIIYKYARVSSLCLGIFRGLYVETHAGHRTHTHMFWL